MVPHIFHNSVFSLFFEKINKARRVNVGRADESDSELCIGLSETGWSQPSGEGSSGGGTEELAASERHDVYELTALNTSDAG
jgi:hypothetical protein